MKLEGLNLSCWAPLAPFPSPPVPPWRSVVAVLRRPRCEDGWMQWMQWMQVEDARGRSSTWGNRGPSPTSANANASGLAYSEHDITPLQP